MFKSHFKTAWRNLLKNKLHSFINIAGLSSGIAVLVLIGLWINNQLSFDKYHKNYSRIAQVMLSQTLNNEVGSQYAVPMPLGDKLRDTYGDNFKRVVMCTGPADHILAANENKLVSSGQYMQYEAPALFSLKMIQGSQDGLKEPGSIILSQSTSLALFGNKNPINELVSFDRDTTLKVTGVYEDLPQNTTLHELAFMVPWELQGHIKDNLHNWGNNGWQIYVQIADNADMQTVSSKIKEAEYSSVDEPNKKYKPVIFLHPMSKWHLYSEFKDGINTGGAIQYVRLFSVIGVIILLLACINFMNLSTARSEKRAREVGIRKAIGSLRKQIVQQFFVESLLVAFLAFLFSLLLIIVLLPVFNQIANEHIGIPWTNPIFWAVSLGFSLIVGLMAGSYPAFYLSSFRPVKVLKGKLITSKTTVLPRKVLVVLQFFATIILIAGTIVVYRQIEYAKNRPVGYNRDGLVNIKVLTPDIYKHFDAFHNDLIASSFVENAAESTAPVTENNNSQGNFDWEGRDKNGTQNFATVGVSQEYGKTIGWQFIDGRDYRTGPGGADHLGFVINESAAKLLGFKEPLGKTVHWYGYNFEILGVVKGMVVESPYLVVQPTIYYLAPWKMNFLNIRMKPGASVSESIEKIKQVYAQYNPGQPFDYKFADDEYARKFSLEQRIGKLAGFFAALAIFISCLGLFGLASFVAEQRRKEIGVRKVLGASVFSVWKLLSKEFAILVLLSIIIAVPVGYYLLHVWLQGYVYRASLSWIIFFAAGSGALLITLVTVSFQSIKAALDNPVNSLRAE